MKELDQIIRRADTTLSTIDNFWNHATNKGWFLNQELKDYVMFMEHEISRSATMIKVHAAELRKKL